MNRINVPRVILGGLAAGVVANALDAAAGMFLLAEDMGKNAQRLGLDSAVLTSGATMATWIAIDFLYGLLIVFTYAAMRPRFGPGPKTALIAGLTLYVTVTIFMAGLTAMGMFMQSGFIKSAAIYLVVNVAASLAGAAIYKE
jgi:hypothetical protein